MNVIIHDLEKEQFENLPFVVSENTIIIADDNHIKNCIGCFSCWTKTPGQCIIKDQYQDMGKILAGANQVTVISKLVYGGYSPFVKNVLDRSIPYLLPFFRTINNESHHKQRYKSTFSLSVFFYGEETISNATETAQALVAANCRNFYVKEHKVFFFQSLEQFSGECVI